jgi:hypothetical protein
MTTPSRRRRKPVRTIEIRRVPSYHPGTCRKQYLVLIPLVFCARKDALTYARGLARSGNALSPQIRTVVRDRT